MHTARQDNAASDARSAAAPTTSDTAQIASARVNASDANGGSRKRATCGADRIIITLAGRQHGVVAREQLLRAGVPSDIIDRRVRSGWLQRLHRGVHLVGPLTAPKTREMAAVLACGDHAAASSQSAAMLWQILQSDYRNRVDVIVRRGRVRSTTSIRVRSVHSLRDDEVTVHDAIPITTPARTLFDLASTLADRDLERALAEALALRIVRRSQIITLLDWHARSPGATRLRRLLTDASHLARTRSEAEERFLTLVRKANLPEPLVNVTVAGFEVDFLWRAQHLVVEIDGRAFHASARRFEGDRRRDAILLAQGFRIMRVTWQQLVNEPEAVLVRLAQALARRIES